MKFNIKPPLSRLELVWFIRLTKGTQAPTEDTDALRRLENRGLAVSKIRKGPVMEGVEIATRVYELTNLGMAHFAASARNVL